MGTRLDLVIPDTDAEACSPCAEEIRTEVLRLEKKLSRFDDTSHISAINRSAGLTAVPVDEETLHILTLCRSYFQATAGAFDVTLLPLISLWKQRMKQPDPTPLKPGEIEPVLAGTGMEKVEIDIHFRTVRFRHPEVRIDLGGFGKGYALKQIAEILQRRQLENAFVSFGDSAVLGLGQHPHGPGWPVGVKHLFDPALSVQTFQLRDQSLSTSGTTPNNTKEAPSWFGHIISPFDGRLISGFRTVSVVSSSALDAEVLSTAFTVLPIEERNRILHSFSDLEAIEFVYDKSGRAEATWRADNRKRH